VGSIATHRQVASDVARAAAMRALRDAGDPLPAAGVCISPWMDLGQSGATLDSNAESDPVMARALLDMMAEAYLNGADAGDPLASPLNADLDGLLPLLIQVGAAEALLDDSRRFAKRAEAAGVEVVLEAREDMFHDWHCYAVMLPEGREAIARIGAFLKERAA
jgi:acetyl esterase/lipase